jgi:DNA invertase Pin-like site-specific DNA recombinase
MISVQPAALQKITARHLSRQAMLYVRQSTLHQVLENTESSARQYGLRERAIALGWEASRIVVIDQDLGQSGASTVDRLGFQHLVAEVGLGHVGLVMGLEVSRLARSSLDWHHLLEICPMTGTLILDEDGLYDPATFNDRLRLWLKGPMAEAELHVLQARLKGGILHKASRAALKVPLPVGLAYAEDQTVILNPDAQIQQAFRLLFATDHSHRISLCHRQILSGPGTALPAPCPHGSSCWRDSLDASATQRRAQSAAQSSVCGSLLLRTDPYQQAC